ncbi:MAG: ribosome maturation factor RimM [Thermoanaerobaculia bacterium]|nr:ribosome maturation factor RimM [Thermoanaerobaculia bacterium]
MPPPPAPDRVLVGRVRRAHGVRGELLVEPLSDVPGRFDPGSELLLVTPDGSSRRARVAATRAHRLGLLITLEGCADRDAAEELRGATLEVPGASVPPAPEGAFYHHELVGCLCHDRRLGELGRVEEVVEDGGGLLLEVATGGRRLLVPFVRSYLRRIDPVAGRIEMDLPEGLLESCAST